MGEASVDEAIIGHRLHGALPEWKRRQWTGLMHLFGISHPIGHKKAFEVEEEEDSLWGPPQNQEEDGEEGRPAAPNPRSLGQNGAASMLAENIHAFAHAYIFFRPPAKAIGIQC